MTRNLFMRARYNVRHPGLNPKLPPQWRVAKKLTREIQTAPRHGIAEASRTVGRPELTPAAGGWVGAVFLGLPPTHNTTLVPPGVCGAWPLLAVWDPRFSRVHRQPSTQLWSLLECAAHGRSSQCGTRGFPWFTANPQHTFGPSWSVRRMAAPRSMGPAVFLGSPPTRNTPLVPPGVCGAWPLLAVWDPRFSWAHRQPTTPINCLNTARKELPFKSLVPNATINQYARAVNTHKHEQRRTRARQERSHRRNNK